MRKLIFLLLFLVASCGDEELGPVKIDIMSPASKAIFQQNDQIQVDILLENSTEPAALYVDDEFKGNFSNNTYLLTSLEPGTHILKAEAKRDIFSDIDEVVISVEQVDSLSQQAPSFTVITPKQDQVYSGSDVQLEMILENLKTALFKVTVDDSSPELIRTTRKIFTLSPGEHAIAIELMKDEANDYGVKKTIKFRTDYIKPPEEFGFEIKFPTEGYGVKGNLVAVRLILNNVSIDPIGTQENVEGRGYFKFYLDGAKEPIKVEKATYTIKDLSAGNHILEVEMVKNDGSTYGLKKKVQFEAQTVTAK